MRKNLLRYFIPIILLSIIGIISILFSKNIIGNYMYFLNKQILFLVIGIILFFAVIKLNFNRIEKYSLIMYFFCVLMLIYVLLFGNVINGSKAWISIFGIGIQPSEFAKITLLLCFNKYIKTKYGLLKGIILLIIPSILTFLEPDTGAVLFYLVMFFSIFVSIGLKKIYYFSIFGFIGVSIILFFYLYFFKSELFINVFGTNFFYRIDRIINFIDNEGYQINNALISIGNGYLFGNGSKYIIYIPEAITDFMFANILTIYGFFGGVVVFMIFLFIDINLIRDINILKSHKFYVIGLFALFMYQQIQHIMMNIGLLPIMGITLPFVSYGGSSLISYFILFGILFNLKKYQLDT